MIMGFDVLQLWRLHRPSEKSHCSLLSAVGHIETEGANGLYGSASSCRMYCIEHTPPFVLGHKAVGSSRSA